MKRNWKLRVENPQNKSPIPVKDIDINIIVVSNKLPFDEQDSKYFIDYKYDKKNLCLCMPRPKTSI